MGLRVRNNASVIQILHNLQRNNQELQRTFDRLSTGRKINRVEDNPTDFAISERIKAQMKSMEQASRNLQDDNNMIGTVDTSIQNVVSQLHRIRSSITFALNNGTASQDQLEAEQSAVDSAVSSIDRIAESTRFNDRSLLDGNNGLEINSTVGSAFNDLIVKQMDFPTGASSRTLEMSLTQSAQRGALEIGSAAADSRLRIFGPRGTRDVDVASGSAGDLRDAINGVAGETGVFVSAAGSAGSTLALTEEFGEDEQVKIELLEGNVEIEGAARSPGFSTSDRGLDPEIRVNGQTVEGRGREFRIISNFIDFEFTLNPAGSTLAIDPSQFNANQRFQVRNSGVNFQTGPGFEREDSLRVGFSSLDSESLGSDQIQDPINRVQGNANADKFGFLESLKSGNSNSLLENPENAKKIIDRALRRATGHQSFLGSLKSGLLDNRKEVTDTLQNNLAETNSQLVDADIAEETARLSRQQVLHEATLAVLGQANTLPQRAIQLLQQ